MSIPLEKVRDAAKQLAATSEEMGARKIDSAVDVQEKDGTKRYFIRVEKIFKRVGRGKAASEIYERTQITVRENSNQGTVIVAIPLEWL